MTTPLRDHTTIDPAEMLDCGSAIRLLGREDYVVRRHIFVDLPPEPASGWRHGLINRMAKTFSLWRRRYQTRRHLRQRDRRGFADIGIAAIEQEREAGKPFWKS